MTLKELQLEITAQTLACWQQAEEFYKIELPVVEIKFDLTGRTAGEAHFREKAFGGWDLKLRFNLNIAEMQLEDFLKETVPHEVAHLVTVFQFQSPGHGKHWQNVMRECFNIVEPTRCHNYKTNSARRTFIYKCSCREHEITSIIHNRIKKGRKYYCKGCKTPLTFWGI